MDRLSAAENSICETLEKVRCATKILIYVEWVAKGGWGLFAGPDGVGRLVTIEFNRIGRFKFETLRGLRCATKLSPMRQGRRLSWVG